MAGLALVLTLMALPGPETIREGQQRAPSHVDEPFTLEEVEVLGRRGKALIDPETELDGAQIDSLGADDIGEVIRRLTEDYALGDAPVVIVNGRRMADPGVFSGFPPDALVRVEVLPPEAAAFYGTADLSRRVVNIVLQRRFQSREGQASLRRPTAGGTSNASVDLRQSAIIDTRTRQMGFQAEVNTALHARDRTLSRTDEPDGDAVTLRPASETFAASLVETASFGDWAASLRGNASTQQTRSVLLRAGESVESRRRVHGLTATGGLTGDLAGWSTRLTLNGSLSDADQSGLSPSVSRQQSISASVGIGRPLFDLPAGPLDLNLTGRASQSRAVADSAGARRTFSGRSSGLNAGLSIPLTRRLLGNHAGGLLGDLSITLGAGLDRSESGQGEGLNAGLAWAPLSKLRFSTNRSTSTQSLPDQQRFEPEYFGEPIRVFDFRTGESVEVLPILGGNPDLRPPRSDRIAISASAGPFTAWKLQGNVNLQRTEAVDGIGFLPDVTPEVEAAFPERFQRDAEGRLVSIDRTPFNLRSAMTETLTSTLGFTVPLHGARRTRPSLVRIVANHTWQLQNALTIQDGLPKLDRLSGDGGGVPRHALGIGIDFSRRPWGLNVAARWRDAYRIRRESGRDGPDDLRMGAFGAIDLGLTFEFERDLPTRGEARTARRGVGLLLGLDVDNLFDTRPRARLGDGRPAPGYGRDDQDPIGRTFRLTLKQRF
nr:TonB-dependent receptor [uncultured Brevundimonas sp.]